MRFLLSVTVFLCLHAVAIAEPPRVLVLSGANNHAWWTTTPEIVRVLEDGGRFQVDVASDVATLDAGAFAPYDVVVSNFNTFPNTTAPVWSAEVRTAFEEHMRRGHGLVIVHAGSTVFPDWPFFQKLAGGRWGDGTSHGKIHDGFVTFTNIAHPITTGLEPFWIRDEFWQDSALAPGAEVLATVVPDPASEGSGKPEPMLVTTEVEGARGVFLVLGHQAEVMRNPAWQTLLQRATAWAARGETSIPPAARWPTQQTDAAWPALGGTATLAALRHAIDASNGQNRAGLNVADRMVGGFAAGAPSARGDAAAVLTEIALSDAVSLAAKEFSLTGLRVLGGPDQVPALRQLGDDPALGFWALSALETIPGKAATAAIGTFVKNPALEGQARRVLAQRAAMAEPVPPGGDAVTDLVRSTDAATRRHAIGRLRGQWSPKLSTALLKALDLLEGPTLAAALALLAEKREAKATAVAGEALDLPGDPGEAAMDLLSRIGAARAVSELVRRIPSRPDAALRALERLPGAGVDAAIFEAIDHAEPAQQAHLIRVLGLRRATEFQSALFSLAESSSAPVRAAAIEALGRLATEEDFSALLAATARTPEASAALWAPVLIASAPGDAAVEPLSKAFDPSRPEQSTLLLTVLAGIGTERAVAVVSERLSSPEERLRRSALIALGRSRHAAALPLLLRARKDEVSPALQRLAFRQALELFDSLAWRQRLQNWPTLELLAREEAVSEDRKLLLATLAKVPTHDSLALVESLEAADASLAPEADAAASAIRKALGLAPAGAGPKNK